MLYLYSIMATNWTPIVIVAVVVAALFAFFLGFKRGFTRTGWGAFIWAIVCLVWYVIVSNMDVKNDVGEFGGIILACGIIAAAFVVFGFIALLVRPKRKPYDVTYHFHKKTEEQEEALEVAARSQQYDLEYGQVENEDEEKEKKERKKERKGKGGPCLFNRILGGITSLVNFALVVVGIGLLAVVFLPVFTDIDLVSTLSLSKDSDLFLRTFTLDFLFIALMMAMGYGGYRAGFLRGVYGAITSCSALIAIAVGVAFPLMGGTLAQNMTEFFGGVFTGILPEKALEFLPNLGEIIGAIVVGLIALILTLIVLWLLSCLVKAMFKETRHSKPFRVVDGILGMVAMIALALALVAFVMAIVALVEYFGVDLGTAKLYTRDSLIGKDLFKAIRDGIASALDGIKG